MLRPEPAARTAAPITREVSFDAATDQYSNRLIEINSGDQVLKDAPRGNSNFNCTQHEQLFQHLQIQSQEADSDIQRYLEHVDPFLKALKASNSAALAEQKAYQTTAKAGDTSTFNTTGYGFEVEDDHLRDKDIQTDHLKLLTVYILRHPFVQGFANKSSEASPETIMPETIMKAFQEGSAVPDRVTAPLTVADSDLNTSLLSSISEGNDADARRSSDQDFTASNDPASPPSNKGGKYALIGVAALITIGSGINVFAGLVAVGAIASIIVAGVSLFITVGAAIALKARSIPDALREASQAAPRGLNLNPHAVQLMALTQQYGQVASTKDKTKTLSGLFPSRLGTEAAFQSRSLQLDSDGQTAHSSPREVTADLKTKDAIQTRDDGLFVHLTEHRGSSTAHHPDGQKLTVDEFKLDLSIEITVNPYDPSQYASTAPDALLAFSQIAEVTQAEGTLSLTSDHLTLITATSLLGSTALTSRCEADHKLDEDAILWAPLSRDQLQAQIDQATILLHKTMDQMPELQSLLEAYEYEDIDEVFDHDFKTRWLEHATNPELDALTTLSTNPELKKKEELLLFISRCYITNSNQQSQICQFLKTDNKITAPILKRCIEQGQTQPMYGLFTANDAGNTSDQLLNILTDAHSDERWKIICDALSSTRKAQDHKAQYTEEGAIDTQFEKLEIQLTEFLTQHPTFMQGMGFDSTEDLKRTLRQHKTNWRNTGVTIGEDSEDSIDASDKIEFLTTAMLSKEKSTKHFNKVELWFAGHAIKMTAQQSPPSLWKALQRMADNSQDNQFAKLFRLDSTPLFRLDSTPIDIDSAKEEKALTEHYTAIFRQDRLKKTRESHQHINSKMAIGVACTLGVALYISLVAFFPASSLVPQIALPALTLLLSIAITVSIGFTVEKRLSFDQDITPTNETNTQITNTKSQTINRAIRPAIRIGILATIGMIISTVITGMNPVSALFNLISTTLVVNTALLPAMLLATGILCAGILYSTFRKDNTYAKNAKTTRRLSRLISYVIPLIMTSISAIPLGMELFGGPTASIFNSGLLSTMPAVHATLLTPTLLTGMIMGVLMLGVILAVIGVSAHLYKRPTLKEIKHEQAEAAEELATLEQPRKEAAEALKQVPANLLSNLEIASSDAETPPSSPENTDSASDDEAEPFNAQAQSITDALFYNEEHREMNWASHQLNESSNHIRQAGEEQASRVKAAISEMFLSGKSQSQLSNTETIEDDLTDKMELDQHSPLRQIFQNKTLMQDIAIIGGQRSLYSCTQMQNRTKRIVERFEHATRKDVDPNSDQLTLKSGAGQTQTVEFNAETHQMIFERTAFLQRKLNGENVDAPIQIESSLILTLNEDHSEIISIHTQTTCDTSMGKNHIAQWALEKRLDTRQMLRWTKGEEPSQEELFLEQQIHKFFTESTSEEDRHHLSQLGFQADPQPRAAVPARVSDALLTAAAHSSDTGLNALLMQEPTLHLQGSDAASSRASGDGFTVPGSADEAVTFDDSPASPPFNKGGKYALIGVGVSLTILMIGSAINVFAGLFAIKATTSWITLALSAICLLGVAIYACTRKVDHHITMPAAKTTDVAASRSFSSSAITKGPHFSTEDNPQELEPEQARATRPRSGS